MWILGRLRSISETLGQFNDRMFYANVIMVSEDPGALCRDSQVIVCDRSTELYLRRTPVSSKDVVLIEYDACEAINTRRYFITEIIKDTTSVAKIIDCSGWGGLFKAQIYLFLFSESNGIAYPTSEVVECAPFFEKDEDKLFNGIFVLLQGKLRRSDINYILRAFNM